MQAVNQLLAQALDLLKHGNTEQAEQEFARAAKASCHAFGENDIVTARMLAHLARLCVSRGKLDVAVSIYERIIYIHEALPATSNTDHALALMDLASLREGCRAAGAGAPDNADTLRRKADKIVNEVGERLQKEAEKEQGGEESDDSEDNAEGGGGNYSGSSEEQDTGDDDSEEKSEGEISVNEDGDHTGGG